MRTLLAGALMVLGATSLAGSQTSPPLQVKDQWVRETPNPRSTAAYMVLVNKSDRDVVIVSASSPAARVAELHEMALDGTTMRMRRVERIRVPKHSEVALKPGGLHLMLIDLARALPAGDHVVLVLGLDDGRKVEVRAPVRPLGSR